MTIPLGLIITDLGLDPGRWADIGDLARSAEDAGAASFWLTDHLYWHRPTVDPLVALHAVASATTSATIGPCVLQLPLRDATTTAKSLSFLEHLAPGRVVAGVGVGEHELEFQLAGHADRFHRRGHVLDAQIDALRAAWWAQEGSFSMAPGRSVPIWVGGRSGAARRRAARVGDGWIPHLCRSPWFAEQMALLDAELARAERDPTAVRRAAALAIHVDGIEPSIDPHAWLGQLYDLPPASFHHVLIRGDRDQVLDELRAFEAAGAQHLALVVAGDQPVAHLDALIRSAA